MLKNLTSLLLFILFTNCERVRIFLIKLGMLLRAAQKLRELFLHFIGKLGITCKFLCPWVDVRRVILLVWCKMEDWRVDFRLLVSIFMVYEATEILLEFGFIGSIYINCSIFAFLVDQKMFPGLYIVTGYVCIYEYLWGCWDNILLRYGFLSFATFIIILFTKIEIL